MRPTRIAALTLILLLRSLPTAAAGLGHPWLTLPDSLLADSLRASGPAFENRWNALLVRMLRGGWRPGGGTSDSTGRALQRIADAEPSGPGSRIAGPALRRLASWDESRIRSLVEAARAESAALAQPTYILRAEALGPVIGLYHGIGESRREAVLLGTQGAYWIRAGGPQLSLADSVDRLALRARREAGDPRLIGNTLFDLGLVAEQRGQPDSAAAWYRASLAIRVEHHFDAQAATTESRLAQLLGQSGDREEAIPAFEGAITKLTALGDSVRLAEVLTLYSGVLGNAGRIERAMTVSERALALAPSPKDESAIRLNRGDALRQAGRYEAAVRELRLAVSCGRAASNAEAVMRARLVLGQALLLVPDPRAALAPLQQARAAAESLGDFAIEIKSLNNLAIAHFALHSPGLARAAARRAWAIADSTRDSTGMHDVAVTRFDQARALGDPREATRWATEAVRIRRGVTDEQRLGDAINLGWALQASRLPDSALAVLRGALDDVRSRRLTALIPVSLLGLGDAIERRGNLEAALALHREAAERVDTLRADQQSESFRIRALGARVDAFEAVIGTLFALERREPGRGHAAEAFQWAERARARSLDDLLEANRRNPARAAPTKVSDVSQRLGLHEALLYYMLGDSASWLWVIRRDGMHAHVLARRAVLLPLLEQARRDLATPERAGGEAARATFAELYRRLVAPAGRSLDGIRTLRIAADGPLGLVPFEVFRDTRASGGKGAWLAQRFATTYLPSARWVLAPAPTITPLRVLAVADPALGTEATRLPPLPGARDEAQQLAALAGPGRVTMLAGREATWNALRESGLDRATLVHVGTHGEPGRETEPPALWFAGEGSSGARRVTPRDIAELHVGARFVTLSACESGVADVARGEGVLGLPRAFLAAGARGVLFTLWPLDDRWGTKLVTGFYERLLAEGRPADEALALARCEMIEHTAARSPYYWAPAVILGDRVELSRPH